MPAKKSTQPETPAARTHMVTGNVLHNGKLYFDGDSITFGAETSEEDIEWLKSKGLLAGEAAEERKLAQAMAEAQSGIRGMTKEEQLKLWRSYIRQAPSDRLATEKADARQKDDTEATRIGAIEENQQDSAEIVLESAE